MGKELMQLIDDKLEFIKALMKDVHEQCSDSSFHFYVGYRNALMWIEEILEEEKKKCLARPEDGIGGENE